MIGMYGMTPRGCVRRLRRDLNRMNKRRPRNRWLFEPKVRRPLGPKLVRGRGLEHRRRPAPFYVTLLPYVVIAAALVVFLFEHVLLR